MNSWTKTQAHIGRIGKNTVSAIQTEEGEMVRVGSRGKVITPDSLFQTLTKGERRKLRKAARIAGFTKVAQS